MRLLLINPNTSASITARLADSARTAMEPQDTLSAVTATTGPRVVRDAAQLAEAQASALALAELHLAGHDALVLGISLDGAARLLRERHPQMPVVGMTEAALFAACLTVERVGLLTIGPAMLPLYEQHVEQIGLSTATRVVAFEAPELAAAFAPDGLRVAPEVLEALTAACHRLRDRGAHGIVLAGAVLCGYAERLGQSCELPVFDGVTCAVRLCRALLASR